MAFKTFVAGDVLTAAEVNTYLAKQAVIVCTSGTRPSSPVEGMTIYETDTGRLMAWDGAKWTTYRIGNEPDVFYTGAVANGTATSFTAFLTQNAVLALPYPYTMVVQVGFVVGANAAINECNIQVQDEAGASINHKTAGAFANWDTKLAAAGALTGTATGKKDYAAAATCGFRLAYKLNTSNIYIDAGVRVSFVPRV